MTMMKQIDVDQFEEIMWGDSYKSVTEETIEDQRRWHTSYSQVFKKLEDGTFWLVNWDRGSTEQQDDGPENIYLVQVAPKEVIVTKYVTI